MTSVDRPLPPCKLDPIQREVYDAILGSRRAGSARPLTDDDGSLLGPFNAMLYNPAVGSAMQALGAALRYGGSLPDRARELVVLVVAERTGCAFERWAHEPLARAAGIDDEALAAVAEGHSAALPGELHAVAEATAALTDDTTLDDAVHAQLRTAYGERGLVELVALAGYYRLLACLMRTFAVEVPSGPVGDGTEPTGE